MKEIIVHSLKETEDLARALADATDGPRVILLEGTLGMGKSSFARAFIRHLAGNDLMEVPSPTFTLLQSYDTAKGEVWHFDLYRLNDPEEIWELDWEDAAAQHITLVEWPDRLGPYTPKDAQTITISAPKPIKGSKSDTESDAENTRIFTISD
jgi:tRNA threonylcarbamoyladenosine biosynthesis protein TsaE